jgi:hypothetical protein
MRSRNLQFFLRRFFGFCRFILRRVWFGHPASRSEWAGTGAAGTHASAGAFLLTSTKTWATTSSAASFTPSWAGTAAGTKLILKPGYLMPPALLLLVGEDCGDFLVHLF